MKSSEIIRESKKLLSNGRNDTDYNLRRYICFTLEAYLDTIESQLSYGHYKVIARKIRGIKKEIRIQLEWCSDMEEWLKEKAGITKGLTARNLQRHRKQWMDILANQYEGKGD